ncbi:MAG: hypothetical protein ACOZAK_00095 [Patescibacteria group bacterium]
MSGHPEIFYSAHPIDLELVEAMVGAIVGIYNSDGQLRDPWLDAFLRLRKVFISDEKNRRSIAEKINKQGRIIKPLLPHTKILKVGQEMRAKHYSQMVLWGDEGGEPISAEAACRQAIDILGSELSILALVNGFDGEGKLVNSVHDWPHAHLYLLWLSGDRELFSQKLEKSVNGFVK